MKSLIVIFVVIGALLTSPAYASSDLSERPHVTTVKPMSGFTYTLVAKKAKKKAKKSATTHDIVIHLHSLNA